VVVPRAELGVPRTLDHRLRHPALDIGVAPPAIRLPGVEQEAAHEPIPRREAKERDVGRGAIQNRGVRTKAGDEVGAVGVEATEHRTVLPIGHRDGRHGAKATSPARQQGQEAHGGKN